jgi:hypothetical protein
MRAIYVKRWYREPVQITVASTDWLYVLLPSIIFIIALIFVVHLTHFCA